MSDPTPRTATEIAADLRRLGLSPADTVMVHASLRAVGPVEGGADGVLDALAEVLGREGTVMMVLGAEDPMAWVNERPEHERAALLEGSEPFDPLVAPAEAEVGVLAEVLRTRPGTVVSDHPEGRFAASGRRAVELTVDVPWDDYYGARSPLERLVAVGGKVLRLGADPDTVTLLHHAEFLVDLPAKRRVRRHRLVRGSEGPVVRVVETLDDSDGIVEVDGEDYFVTILEAYLALGRASVGAVGDATSELIDARDIVAFGLAWMADHLPRLRVDRRRERQ